MVSNDENRDGFTQRSIDAYNLAVASGNTKAIEQAKYALLTDAISILGIVVNYIALGQNGIHFDFGTSRIRKGTQLFRIRRYQPNIDFDDLSAWEPNPNRPQGRANRQGQEALYLGSTETVCLLETHTAIGQQYALGSYECIDDVVVGGFLRFDSANKLHNIAGMVLNSFLIAPSREERNLDLFGFLDMHYGRILLDDLCDLTCITERGGLELPVNIPRHSRGLLLGPRRACYCSGDAATTGRPPTAAAYSKRLPSSCFLMYSLITSSFSPTVLT